jgi:hypothetical protein
LYTAKQFGDAVVAGAFLRAHALLTPDEQQRTSPEDLRDDVEHMIAYAEGEPLETAEVMTETVLYEWPAKEDGDLVWVYVALKGSTYCEGVSLVLAETNEGIRIREIEWGRP